MHVGCCDGRSLWNNGTNSFPHRDIQPACNDPALHGARRVIQRLMRLARDHHSLILDESIPVYVHEARHGSGIDVAARNRYTTLDRSAAPGTKKIFNAAPHAPGQRRLAWCSDLTRVNARPSPN